MDESDTFTRRATVSEAAELLCITPDAVRKRVERDKIMYERDDAGRLIVWVDPSEIKTDKSRDTSEDRLIRSLEEQNRFLREELARKDAILLNMTEVMKALSPLAAQEEPPVEPEAPTEAAEQPGRVGASAGRTNSVGHRAPVVAEGVRG